VLVDPSEWHEVDYSSAPLFDAYALLGFSIHAHEVHIADVVVKFSSLDDEEKDRIVTVLVEAESEEEAKKNVEAARDLLLYPELPKLASDGLYAFEGKINALDPRRRLSGTEAMLVEMRAHRSCEKCLEMIRLLGHSGYEASCPDFKRMWDEYRRLDKLEKLEREKVG
jgi:hypothetical protein